MITITQRVNHFIVQRPLLLDSFGPSLVGTDIALSIMDSVKVRLGHLVKNLLGILWGDDTGVCNIRPILRTLEHTGSWREHCLICCSCREDIGDELDGESEDCIISVGKPKLVIFRLELVCEVKGISHRICCRGNTGISIYDNYSPVSVCKSGAVKLRGELRSEWGRLKTNSWHRNWSSLEVPSWFPRSIPHTTSSSFSIHHLLIWL